MNNRFVYFIIKSLYSFKFDKILRFNFKNLAIFFYKFCINKIISSNLDIA